MHGFCLYKNINEPVKLIIGPSGYPHTNLFDGKILLVMGVTLAYPYLTEILLLS